MAKAEPILERLLRRIEINAEGCWIWLGCSSRGYGYISEGPRGMPTHRVAYEQLVGAIPEGFHIDHLCRVRLCCNPDHLEAVTQAENNRRTRRTHCRKGHELIAGNLYETTTPRGCYHRTCRTCALERARLQLVKKGER